MKNPPNRRLELELQLEQRRIAELHRELEQMLLRARERSEESRKRFMANMGRFHSHLMFIRH